MRAADVTMRPTCRYRGQAGQGGTPVPREGMVALTQLAEKCADAILAEAWARSQQLNDHIRC
jgi:hypothetical protein